MRFSRQTHSSRVGTIPALATDLLSEGGHVIEGLRLDITGTELQARLDERIAIHRGREGLLIAQLDRLEHQPGVDETQDDDDSGPFLCRSDSPVRATHRRLERLQARLGMLVFLREHLHPGETYRLDTDDLAVIELIPERSPFG